MNPFIHDRFVKLFVFQFIVIVLLYIRMMIFDTLRDFAGSVFNNVKEAYDKVGTVGRALVATAEKWAGGEYHAPDFTGGGVYSYCGPGTKLGSAGQPINAVDSACRTHDIEYDQMAKLKGTMPTGNFNQLVRQSDEKLIKAIDASGQTDWGARLARWGIRAKTKAEDWGLLNPGKFVV
jgi:hypothetical protein